MFYAFITNIACFVLYAFLNEKKSRTSKQDTHLETTIQDQSRHPLGYKSKLSFPKEKTNTILSLDRLTKRFRFNNA